MRILIVDVKVKPESVEAFVAATRENAAASLREPGIARFELLRDEADPCRFALIEAYRDDEGQGRHRETAHYKKWRDAVEPMMAEPRTRSAYFPIA
jgi:(4S)-4-hydroxy-5-phosphonooxypentane-2,3-dione isomerase